MAPKSRSIVAWLLLLLMQLLPGRLVVGGDQQQQRPAVPNDMQKQILHNTFKALLNYHHKQTSLTEADLPAAPYRSRSMVVASKYMKELFERYKSNTVITKTQGNIVRSISPTIGHVNGERVLKFNLNAINGREAVIKAELHYHYGGGGGGGRRRRRRTMRTPICLLMTASGQRTEIKQINWDQTGQWIAYDVRNAVVAAVQQWSSQAENGRNDSQAPSISIAFAGDALLLPYRASYHSPEKVIRYHAPFLLVHSEQTELVDRKQMFSAVLADTNNKVSRAKRSVDEPQYFAYSVANDGKTSNQIDEQRFVQQVRAFQQQGPAAVLRSNRRRRPPAADKQLRKNKHFEFNRKFEAKRQPFGSNAVKDNRSIRRHEDVSSADDYAAVVLLTGTQPTKCNKHNLLVDFRDIGWGDRIIAPKTFEAHYCAGSCHFPLNWRSNPSNHAIIQSIIHTIGLQPEVPEVCCSPDKMDSLTLLYFDEDQNVVLKTYPKMVVTSCGCL